MSKSLRNATPENLDSTAVASFSANSSRASTNRRATAATTRSTPPKPSLTPSAPSSLQWNVDAMVDDYVNTVSAATGRELTWEHDDVALQNIQARARGPGVWLLANLRDALLLTTSNRSEAAVGYATMDGDTCGGLAPIAGIDKAFLLDWLKWMETTGPAGIGPLPALSGGQPGLQPTAELRPPGARPNRRSRPHALSRARRHRARGHPRQAAAGRSLRSRPAPVPAVRKVQQIGAWVERFFRLWCRNQWKRERYAPSFHLDDENLDPKTWCRFPILNSGFEKELASCASCIGK